MNIVGFDFGTTNSLISKVIGTHVIHCLDEERRPIPSIACYEGAKTILGREAKNRLSQAGLGIHGNIVRSPKMFLGQSSIFIGGVEKNPTEIVRDVIEHIIHQTLTQERIEDLGKIDGAVVTIPVDMQGYQRQALREAFKMAGIGIVQFVHEPLAALYGFFRINGLSEMLRKFDKKLILVFDWGGGTLDLTLCRPMDNMVVQIMNDGTDEVGGDVFDETIANKLVQLVCNNRGYGKSTDIHPGAKERLLDRCERAKIDLSFRNSVSIYVGSYFHGVNEEEFDFALSQEEIEEIVSPLLEKGFRRIVNILDKAGYSSEQVALCLATGGMSNMPAVKRRLHELFGPERVQVPDETSTMISEGAAWIAVDDAQLMLAKNVELLIARNSHLPLVKAGTSMPKEGEVCRETFHLYCTDPRDAVAKFQFYSPTRSGAKVLPGEPRTHLQTLTVKVDGRARAFEERIELDIQINDDLILNAHARSLNMRDEDRCEIHNLEFGLMFPAKEVVLDMESKNSEIQVVKEEAHPLGSLTIRANVADEIDMALVPGEFLNQYDPGYFDRRRFPPELQNLEKLYYQPCSLCRRSSNDPACRCNSILPNQDITTGSRMLDDQE